MKQLEFTTEKGTFLIVDFPEGAYDVHLCNQRIQYDMDKYTEGPTRFWHCNDKNIPDGDWVTIGKVKELTEAQFKVIVDEPYKLQSCDIRRHNAALITYKQRFFEILESLGVCLENPFGPQQPCFIDTPLSWDSESLESDIKKWQEAQEKVFVNPVIFRVL